MEVKVVPALQDNFMYLLIDTNTKQSAVIDPVEPDKLMAFIAQEGLQLNCVLTTHHHFDHSGGNEAIVGMRPKLPVYGGDDRIPKLSHKVSHGEQLQIGFLKVTCFETPCHTSGHICYFVESQDKKDPVVFTGDTLFLAGCGKFFEGTAPEMYKSLIKVLGVLPKNTLVFCGHEYALNNLSFARHCQPDNEAVKIKIDNVKERLSKELPSVPSTLEEEFKYNPFMRVDQPEIHIFTGTTDPIESMGKLRAAKDGFKPVPL
ncbi:Hydroxyacylglutathione hydrolase, mitochondrial [Oopsacas minuta]|uniref:hydroxyacylglutathione hydrolase n=1 Tax=Oopsacas minuta TaxID=111878 RepID=A0AAV7JDA5_9METZ|nr:Hydroxyacylglutathione hydrolase, mitochondrial [Oopsacas minuta]